MFLVQLLTIVSISLLTSSGYEYQCSAQLGKIAWYIDEELLHEHQQQPLTLERFTKFFESQKMPQGETKNIIQEDVKSDIETIVNSCTRNKYVIG